MLAQPRLPQQPALMPPVRGLQPPQLQQPMGWNPGAPQAVPFPTEALPRAAASPSEPLVTTPPQPIVRGVAGEEETPAPVAVRPAPMAPDSVVLPSPEELGVAPAVLAQPLAPVDWNVVRQRLQRLGALSFHVQQLDRNYRVVFELPTGHNDRTHLVEAVAASEAQAVMLALQRAEQWRRGR